MRMRQSIADIEEAFFEEIEEDRERRDRLRRHAEQRARHRHAARTHRHGTLRFALVLLVLIATAMLPHGYTMASPGIVVASIDHAMWFHRPLRVDEWLLSSMESPVAAGSTLGQRFRFAGEQGCAHHDRGGRPAGQPRVRTGRARRARRARRGSMTT